MNLLGHYCDHVTGTAGRRKRRASHGWAWSLALLALAALAVGCSL